MTELREMRVLLTGASSGIGAATARQLAEQGADVALLARGRKGLNEVAASVKPDALAAALLDLPGPNDFPRLVAALVRTELENDCDAVREAARG